MMCIDLTEFLSYLLDKIEDTINLTYRKFLK